MKAVAIVLYNRVGWQLLFWPSRSTIHYDATPKAMVQSHYIVMGKSGIDLKVSLLRNETNIICSKDKNEKARAYTKGMFGWVDGE